LGPTVVSRARLVFTKFMGDPAAWTLLLVLLAQAALGEGASCASFGAPLSAPPFSDAEVSQLQAFLLANIQSSGAVMASPDDNVLTAGSYRNHWSRDGALTMRTVLQTMENTTATALLAQFVKVCSTCFGVVMRNAIHQELIATKTTTQFRNGR
jgi:hypothetical protein